MRTYNNHNLIRNPFVFLDRPGVDEDLYIERNCPVVDKDKKAQFIQILGDKGFGKTTYLLHLQETKKANYKYIPEGLRRFCLLPISNYVLIDEVDRYPKILLFFYMLIYRFLGTNIVVGTHEDLSLIAKCLRFNFIPFEFSKLNLTFFKGWIDKRLDKNQLDGRPPVPNDEELMDILNKSNNSLREATYYLHVWYAKFCNKEL